MRHWIVPSANWRPGMCLAKSCALPRGQPQSGESLPPSPGPGRSRGLSEPPASLVSTPPRPARHVKCSDSVSRGLQRSRRCTCPDPVQEPVQRLRHITLSSPNPCLHHLDGLHNTGDPSAKSIDKASSLSYSRTRWSVTSLPAARSLPRSQHLFIACSASSPISSNVSSMKGLRGQTKDHRLKEGKP